MEPATVVPEHAQGERRGWDVAEIWARLSQASKRTRRIPLSRHIPFMLPVLAASAYGQYLTLVPDRNATLLTDSPAYVAAANQITHHLQVFDALRTPLYPALLALIFAIRGHVALAYIAGTQAILLSMAALFGYGIAYSISRRRWIAAAAAMLMAMNIWSLNWERTIMTEALAEWLVMALLFTFCLWTRYPSRLTAIAFALLAALAPLERPALLPIPLLLLAVLAVLEARSRRLWARLPTIAAVLAVAYGTVGLYAVGNGLVTGYFGLSYVTDINLFGRVMDFGMQEYGDRSRYGALISEVDHYAARRATGQPLDPNDFGHLNPQYGSIDRYRHAGQLSRQVIVSHPLEYVSHSLGRVPVIATAEPLTFAAYGQVTPQLITTLNVMRTNLYKAYVLLPLLTVLVLVWFAVRPGPQSGTALSAAAIVTLVLLTVALAAYDYAGIYRLREPVDDLMLVLVMVMLLQPVGLLLERGGRAVGRLKASTTWTRAQPGAR